MKICRLDQIDQLLQIVFTFDEAAALPPLDVVLEAESQSLAIVCDPA